MGSIVLTLSERAMTKTLLCRRHVEEKTRTSSSEIKPRVFAKRIFGPHDNRDLTLIDIRFSGIAIFQGLVEFGDLICQLLEPVHIQRQWWLRQGFGGGDTSKREVDSLFSDLALARRFVEVDDS